MNRIRQILKEKSLTQKDLENITGIRQTTISRIINGKNVMLDTAKKISIALDYPIEYIWPDKE